MKTIYVCEICGSKYDTAQEAERCEAKPMRDFDPDRFVGGCHIPEVGEVVECSYPATGWWKGDPDWAVWRERGGRFLDGYYAKWVVVAKIPAGDRHSWRYILWTPSDIIGRERLAWTGPDHNRCHANRMATDEEMQAALKAYGAERPHSIPLL